MKLQPELHFHKQTSLNTQVPKCFYSLSQHLFQQKGTDSKNSKFKPKRIAQAKSLPD
jgi:hypothetical protein